MARRFSGGIGQHGRWGRRGRDGGNWSPFNPWQGRNYWYYGGPYFGNFYNWWAGYGYPWGNYYPYYTYYPRYTYYPYYRTSPSYHDCCVDLDTGTIFCGGWSYPGTILSVSGNRAEVQHAGGVSGYPICREAA